MGPNGTGKSTLVQTVLGRLPLAAGDAAHGPSVVVGELGQDRRALGGAGSVVDALTGAPPGSRWEARSLLAKFGLGADAVTRPPSSLSPGERTRAELAAFAAMGVNFLVLDEPTNHLDLPAIEQLESALAIFDGTLLLVSHDRRLLESVQLTRRVELPDARCSRSGVCVSTARSRGPPDKADGEAHPAERGHAPRSQPRCAAASPRRILLRRRCRRLGCGTARWRSGGEARAEQHGERR